MRIILGGNEWLSDRYLQIATQAMVKGYKKIPRNLQPELKKFETALSKKLEAWQLSLVKPAGVVKKRNFV